MGSQSGKHCAAVFGDSDKMFGFCNKNYWKSNKFRTANEQLMVYEGNAFTLYWRDGTVVLEMRECGSKDGNILIKFGLVYSE